MFKKVLIANRGEIACRIMRTCQALNIRTVAIYSEADAYAQHVLQADEAYCVGAAPSQDSYLNMDAILAVADKTGAEAIHPGYGFLSENAEFAQQCAQHQRVFIGPSAEAIRNMGNKDVARRIMADSGIPVTPGYDGQSQSPEMLHQQADKLGYPIMIKAISGGGGKGMRVVHQSDQFLSALASTQREAKASFGDQRVILEKYLLNPRHIEVQVFADSHGQAVHLFERDCSVQRRHQKIIEEAPGSHIAAAVRDKITQTAVQCAKSIAYVGAGTVEFLLDADDNFYFMEMNTRLQVEHPVTELITGVDLVAWQLQVAAGESLPLKQAAIKQRGHAIEVRVYAEDPDHDFLPSIGQVQQLCLPLLTSEVRVDSGISAGDTITQYYDPMIAKLIVYGTDRSVAINRMQRALNQTYVIGLKTNLDYLRRLLSLPAFADHAPNTGFIEQHKTALSQATQTASPQAYIAAALVYAQTRHDKSSVWAQAGWRMNLNYQCELQVQSRDVTRTLILSFAKKEIKVDLDGHVYVCRLKVQSNRLQMQIADQSMNADFYFENPQTLHIIHDGHYDSFQLNSPFGAYEYEEESEHSLNAPMPATVTAVMVGQGQSVSAGESLLVLEAMKMEHTISAPSDGIVKAIFFEVGERVDEGAMLVEFEGAV